MENEHCDPLGVSRLAVVMASAKCARGEAEVVSDVNNGFGGRQLRLPWWWSEVCQGAGRQRRGDFYPSEVGKGVDPREVALEFTDAVVSLLR